jgi:hypothetical protein
MLQMEMMLQSLEFRVINVAIVRDKNIFLKHAMIMKSNILKGWVPKTLLSS